MRFRPCIDIHNGAVKQIVGGSLSESDDYVKENFSSEQDSSFYADLYRRHNLSGGHVIILNHSSSRFYEADVEQAVNALRTYPGGLQVGGGINPQNAGRFLEAGASHVIVTSYVFNNGQFNEEALNEMVKAVGPQRLVLDLSCRVRDEDYYIVTDRWQKYTEVKLSAEVLKKLSASCDEFLVHAADVEGLSKGIDPHLIPILAESPIPITYAGGVHSEEDINLLKELGEGRVDYTIGSALDLFGGPMKFSEIVAAANKNT